MIGIGRRDIYTVPLPSGVGFLTGNGLLRGCGGPVTVIPSLPIRGQWKLGIPILKGWTIILPRVVVTGLNLSDRGGGGSVEHIVLKSRISRSCAVGNGRSGNGGGGDTRWPTLKHVVHWKDVEISSSTSLI